MDGTSQTVPHSRAAWEHWRKLGSPKYHVAPMVDQSELPFRLLCRKYGSTAAYTPMMHARLFAESAAYRAEHFTTCPEDRPLFVQFCANDPAVLLKAAGHVDEGECDYVDLNLGCPQRIAKRGHYGAFLMDDLPTVKSLVETLHRELKTPVSVKIRIFPELKDTIAYAQMLEQAGASLIAVHGRTRDHKSSHLVRADWDIIKAVKAAVSVPVLGNGNIRTLSDVHKLIAYTGVDGVMSAESLLEDPRLFWPPRVQGEPFVDTQRMQLAVEYLDICEEYPVPMRMVRGHLHRFLGDWLQEHTDIRDAFVRQPGLDLPFCRDTVQRLQAAVDVVGRDRPVPKLSQRKLDRLAREAAMSAAKEQQELEANGLASLQNGSISTQCAAAHRAVPSTATSSSHAKSGLTQFLETVESAAKESGAGCSDGKEQAAALKPRQEAKHVTEAQLKSSKAGPSDEGELCGSRFKTDLARHVTRGNGDEEMRCSSCRGLRSVVCSDSGAAAEMSVMHVKDGGCVTCGGGAILHTTPTSLSRDGDAVSHHSAAGVGCNASFVSPGKGQAIALATSPWMGEDLKASAVADYHNGWPADHCRAPRDSVPSSAAVNDIDQVARPPKQARLDFPCA